MVALKNEKTTYPPLSLSAVLKGVLAALIVTVLGSALLGILYHVTSLGEKTLPLASNTLYYVSVFAGGLLAARWAGYKGLVHGIGVAVVFLLFSWLISSFLLHTQSAAGATFQRVIISCLTGAVGGILGVGVSRQ
ncbi:TIGR04086 family membrane protein [Desulfoscipio gibsoniae]|uniref:Putative membrane protein, TIGR04086 family/integral membrane protein, TIGR04097 family n=1 Tax=Desulfoscipio gibsoniae DSM 7213 TaxID=767817 RepID=R4KFR6_9FIRM|nr:TIGR04086 family membrane protein [Desulfoscipio gibsoniae]AGL01449.1 putative membrane protein, TIGR04086 family/integral membrane protein, TIGR04097 family [Desulfoscipio gibsoniae DSM 7213]